MSNFIKKLFGTLTEKPWESDRAKIDDAHIGKTFDLSVQTSAVIIIFGIATVLFSLIFTGYIYSIPPEQDTRYLLKPNFLWINTFVLFVIAYFFSKITSDLKQKETMRIKRNIILVGGLSYLFLFGQLYFWVQLMQSGNYVSTNSYFSSFYIFTALHGIMLGKFGILVVLLILVLLFYVVISFGAGAFSKGETKPETKKYLKSVKILLAVIAVVGSILVLFLD